MIITEKEKKKKNFLYITFEGSFYTCSSTLMDVSTILSMFIFAYAGNYKLVGLTATIRLLCINLPQLFVGYYMGSIKNISKVIKIIMIVSRPLPLIMTFILLSHLSDLEKVCGFFVVFALMELGEGIKSVPWLDLVSRGVEANVRGKLHGKHLFYGGIGSVILGAFIKIIVQMKGVSLDTRYSIFFGLIGLLGLLSAIFMLKVTDCNRKMPEKRESLQVYLKSLPKYLSRNKEFRKIIIIQMCTSISSIMTPFIIVFCKNRFMMNDSKISTLILIQVIGGFIGGLIWGNISYYVGNKKVVQIAQLLALLVNVLLMICFFTQEPLIITILVGVVNLVAGINMGAWLGVTNYMIDIVDEMSRPTYLVISNILLLPLVCTSYIAGIAADYFGFLILMIIGTIFSFICLIISYKLSIQNHQNHLRHKF